MACNYKTLSTLYLLNPKFEFFTLPYWGNRYIFLPSGGLWLNCNWDVGLGDVRLGDVRLGDVRLGNVGFGDLRIGDPRLGDVGLGDLRIWDMRLRDQPNGYQIVMSEFRLSLSYELYVFSPEWRCRTHKLLIKAHFRPIFDTMHNLLRLKYTSIRISEVFQISWIPSLFSM